MRVTPPGVLLASAVLVRAGGFPYDSGLEQAAWVVAGAACLASLRWGAAAVALVTWATVIGDYYNHVLFIAWMSTTFVLFADPGQQRRIVRAQLSIVYGFAAISKLSPVWLSGEALTIAGSPLPESLLLPAAVAGLLAEAGLAVGLWHPRLRPAVLAVGAVSHLAFWLLIGGRGLAEWGLLPFNLLAFGLLAWSTSRPRQ